MPGTSLIGYRMTIKDFRRMLIEQEGVCAIRGVQLPQRDDAASSYFRAAQWPPAYLVGLGLISWQGGFGGQGHIALWWDIAVVAVFSLGIYY
ncbi:hypothetical protein [Streptomyces brasiliensis]